MPEISNNIEEETDKEVRSTFDWWGQCTSSIKKPLLQGLVYIARLSAKRPVLTVGISIFVALLFAVVGLFTNFSIENDATVVSTPTGCNSVIHGDWVASEDSGFPQASRNIHVIVHVDGGNALGREGASRMFDVIDTIRSTPGYTDLCRLGRGNVDDECPINSVTGFWANHNRTLFAQEVQSDEDAILAMSALSFASGEGVGRTTIYGLPEPGLQQNPALLAGRNVSEYLLESVAAYMCTVFLPPEEEDALPFEAEVTDRLFELERLWGSSNADNKFILELNTDRSYDDELRRGISEDIPVLAVAFIMMGVFCAFTMAKWHRVRSQSLLGVGAIVTIILAMLTGYGLMFCIGVPFTSLVQIFPYVMVGIGLDDTYILTGAFARTDPEKLIEDRLEEVMEEVGVSITASTLTTFCAFMLCSLASLPGIRWFGFYAGPTVLFDFFYQITFFIALIAIDDMRQKANRRDCCPCCIAKVTDVSTEGDDDNSDDEERNSKRDLSKIMTKLVDSYSELLLRPISKVLVLLTFSVLLALGGLGASQQSQQFDFRSLTPGGSFFRDFMDSMDIYFGGSQGDTLFNAAYYFRDIDVSVEANQAEIFNFVDDMVDMEYINSSPTFFWLRDFLLFQNQTTELQNVTFFDQLDVFLNTEPYSGLYKNDVVRNADKYVTASRVRFVYDNVDEYDNEEQIKVLRAQSQVARQQSQNAGLGVDRWPVFSMGFTYYLWELYAAILKEVLFTFILGLSAVFVVALVFVPHPFGALLITPVVAMVYVELLAVLWIAGIYINSISAIGLTMSIGLVVDFNMHIVLAYFEVEDAVTRDERVKKVLKTMGKSIMLGGFSTLLGVLPLSFSGSEAFRTIFVTFMGIVFLGGGHGLVFMPVVLSLIAPHTSRVEGTGVPMKEKPEGIDNSGGTSATMTNESEVIMSTDGLWVTNEEVQSQASEELWA